MQISPQQLRHAQRLARENAGFNFARVFTDEGMERYLSESKVLVTSEAAIIRVSVDHELSLLVDPRRVRAAFKMLRWLLEELEFSVWCEIHHANRSVLRAAQRLGFKVIAGTDDALFLRRAWKGEVGA